MTSREMCSTSAAIGYSANGPSAARTAGADRRRRASARRSIHAVVVAVEQGEPAGGGERPLGRVGYSTLPGSPKWLAARMPSTPIEMCAHPPGDRGERCRLGFGVLEVGDHVAGAGGHRRRRLVARSKAPAAGDRLPEVLIVASGLEARSQVMIPVPIQLVDELVVPIDLGRWSCSMSGSVPINEDRSVLIRARMVPCPRPRGACWPCSAALQSRPFWSGPELAAHLDVTVRTVRRDVERLRQLGYPVESEPGVAGGYRLGSAARRCRR